MNEEILSQLKDIHWPKPPPFWPLAIGYYGAFILALILLASGVFFAWRWQKRQKIRRAITQEFLLIRKNFADDLDVARLQASISALLRRIIFHKSQSGHAKNADLKALATPLEKIFPNREKNDLIIDLVETDRFMKSPRVDGEHLLKLVGEQLKRCRI
ncbi:MAG TPA: DUF4381 domain-containing protein [Myxococcota bacterium]|nr:DUF4381 domain-containing protein [Myxococcota bacterium]